MLERIPPVRRSAPLVLAVFAVGVGIGALVIALDHHGTAKKGVVRRAARSTPKTTSQPANQLPAASEGVQPDRQTTEEPTGAVTGGSVVPAGAEASFTALSARLGGKVGLAVAPLGQGPVQTLGSLQEGHAW